MIVYIFVALLLISLFIPKLREFLKKNLGGDIIGVSLIVVAIDLYFLLILHPKVVNLYKDSGLQLPDTVNPIQYVVLLIASLLLVLVGNWYRKQKNKNSLAFYILSLLLIVYMGLAMGIFIGGVINPIYKLTETL